MVVGRSRTADIRSEYCHKLRRVHAHAQFTRLIGHLQCKIGDMENCRRACKWRRKPYSGNDSAETDETIVAVRLRRFPADGEPRNNPGHPTGRGAEAHPRDGPAARAR